MSFFKLRSNRANDEQSAPGSSPSKSIESLRRSARHRLMGATVLVLVAVVGFPLLFDTQPRPVKSDIQIAITEKEKAKPSEQTNSAKSTSYNNNAKTVSSNSNPDKDAQAVDKAKDSSSSSVVATTGVAAGVVAASAGRSFSSAISAITTPAAPSNMSANSAGTSGVSNNVVANNAQSGTSDPKEVIISTKAPQSKVSSAENSASTSASSNGASSTSVATAKEVKDSKDSKESKDDRDASSSKDSKPIKQLVQVGVYTDPAKIKEYRAKLEKAGFKVNLHEGPVKDGVKRIRIRVGPLKNKEEAQHAIEKIKELKIPGAQYNLIPQP